MTQQGWLDGQGLGSSVHGMADALDNEGQKPTDKRGFGYVPVNHPGAVKLVAKSCVTVSCSSIAE